MIRHSEKNSKKKITSPYARKSSRALRNIRAIPATSMMPAHVVAHSRGPNSMTCLTKWTATATSISTPITLLCCQNHQPKQNRRPQNHQHPTNEKEILIHCLVNRSLVLKHPKQKKHLNNRYYVCFGGSSLKSIAHETLFLELALRGYDLSKPLRPDVEGPSETAEIVKIG